MAKTSGSIIGQGRSFTFVSHILSTISKRRLTVHVVIIPMLGYINQLQDNLIREKTKKKTKTAHPLVTQCCVISCFNDFQLHLGASLQESELRLCQKKHLTEDRERNHRKKEVTIIQT